MANDAAKMLADAEALASDIVAKGQAIGLPFSAATCDIGSTRPPLGSDGRPLAETVFRWIDPKLRYWEDTGFALRSAFIHASRACAEPYYFVDGRFGSWRPNRALEAITSEGPIERWGVGAAIVAPTHLPRGLIGIVVWATVDEHFDVEAVFAAHAAEMHVLALKFVATYADAIAGSDGPPARLTRREIQCLKWAAAGKTDAEISQLVAIALPTVRFHIGNAARKLSVTGRSQAIHRAAVLGYIGAGG
ncbi:helix-turn-helix transcriptional regulator [uncultured Phenylobacterium sp.]|uniref:helix-turn-helix transcriptional regulator n=1 Tax=uncultured Phenylobacterium sp. TaxID=349273 RepID=UPI0025D6BB30|nr:helix-turn-helix transcriptional regulator [uncultured Phenylobacterium sp.]